MDLTRANEWPGCECVWIMAIVRTARKDYIIIASTISLASIIIS